MIAKTVHQYGTLDGIRGMAALSIVVLHCHRFFAGFDLPIGGLAVDLFFVLSGFVLSHAYAAKFASGLSPARFITIRVIRLYPLYLAGTALGILQAVLAAHYQQGAEPWTWGEIAKALPWGLTMIPNPLSRTMYPFDGVMWSIGFELAVNLVWALSWRWLRSTKVLIAVILSAGVAMAAISIIRHSTSLGDDWSGFAGGMARTLYGFFLGVLIYRTKDRVRLPKVAPWLLMAAVPAIFLAPLTIYPRLAVAMFGLPWLVVLGARVEPRGLLQSACRLIGLASYAIYAVHKRLYLLSYALLLKVAHWDATQAAPWIGFAFMASLVLVCVGADRLYDGPARRSLMRLVRGPARALDPSGLAASA